MSNPYSIKEIIKVLSITKPNQKIRFQIRHPENAHTLIGIAVTCSLMVARRFELLTISNNAGNLHLALAQKGDVVFTEDVRTDNNDNLDLTEDGTKYKISDRTFSIVGKKRSYFEANYKVTNAIIEGYYEDTLLPKSTLEGPSKEGNEYYKVRIYLRYETLSSCEDEH